MVTIRLGIYVLSTAVITAALPYEDDPRFIHWHHAEYVTEISELLFVKMQTAARYFLPRTPCQAMRKIKQIGLNSFKYVVHYIPDATSNEIKTFVTRLTTSITMPHTTANAMTYQTTERGPFWLYKVLYADRRSRCFILVFVERIGIRACRLLQPSSTIDQPVPKDCQKIYATHCPPHSVTIYMPSCRERLGQLRPPSPPASCCKQQ